MGELAGRRLLELPALVVVVALLAALVAVFAAVAWRRRRSGRPLPTGRSLGLALAVVGAAVFALLVDRKLSRLEEEIGQLHYELRRIALDSAGAPAPVRPPLFDEGRVRAGLAEAFGELRMKLEPLNEAMDFAVIRLGALPGRAVAVAYVSVIDLTHPRVEISITGRHGAKRPTSAFARENGCAVAINGEAGTSPRDGAPLGVYAGNWIVRGEPILLADTPQRPFLSFDRGNRGRYFRASLVDAEVSPEKYNTIWGRVDMLIGGEGVPPRGRRWLSRDPRTLMALDAAGERLYLAVVDGRQRGYSDGLTLTEAAGILRLFGATDGMGCDQGGSSIMVVGAKGGVVTRPSDGIERPVYSHFCVGLRND